MYTVPSQRAAQAINQILTTHSSTDPLHSAVIAAVIAEYAPLTPTATGIKDHITKVVVNSYLNKFLNTLSEHLPIKVAAIRNYLTQMMLYREAVTRGSVAVGGADVVKPVNSIEWLFGMNMYMSDELRGMLSTKEAATLTAMYKMLIRELMLNQLTIQGGE